MVLYIKGYFVDDCSPVVYNNDELMSYKIELLILVVIALALVTIWFVKVYIAYTRGNIGMRKELDISSNDRRRPLLDNSVVHINGIEYEVISELGRGASSISYTAVGNGTTKVLVEFYPQKVESSVFDNDIINWIQDESYEEYRKRFFDSVNTQQEFYNNAQTQNYTCEVEGPFEANNTFYKIEAANAGDFDYEKATIETTTEVLIHLCEFLGSIHQVGWLAIDISPGNLYYANDQGYIKLFDFDSCLRMDQIKNENVYIRFTADYAPDEVIKGERRKINNTSDYFCAAMILYSKILPNEKRPCFPHFGVKLPGDIDLDDLTEMIRNSDVFKEKNYDPAVYRAIAEWLYSLLNISTEREKDEQKILSGLRRIHELLKNDIYFISSNFSSGDCFVGREKEIEQINNNLQNNRIVVLHGMGGIGKSSIARRYAELYRSRYDVIFTVKYMGTTESIFEEIYSNNVNCKEDSLSFEDKKKTIRNYCEDKRVLLIVDDFDVLEKVSQSDLVDVNWSVILTSRNTEAGKLGPAIEINENKEEAIKLFTEYFLSTGGHETEVNVDVVKSICNEVGYNSLAIEIVARNCGLNDISVEQMYKFINKEMNNSNSDNEITYMKDDIDYGDVNTYEILRRVFDLTLTNSKNEQVLNTKAKIILYFISCCNNSINAEVLLYKIWMRNKVSFEEYIFENKGIFKKLERLGWIKGNFTVDNICEYSMHRLVENMVRNDLNDQMWSQQFAHCIEFMTSSIYEMMFITDAFDKIDDTKASNYYKMMDDLKKNLELCKDRIPNKIFVTYNTLLDMQKTKIRILEKHSKLWHEYYRCKLLNIAYSKPLIQCFLDFIEILKEYDNRITIGLGIDSLVVKEISDDYLVSNAWFWNLKEEEQIRILMKGLFRVSYKKDDKNNKIPIVEDLLYIQYLDKWNYQVLGEREPWVRKVLSYARKWADIGYKEYQYQCAKEMIYNMIDVDKAIEYLKKAARNGHQRAAYKLGKIYEEGKLVRQDYANAVCWYGFAGEVLDSYERIESIRNKSFLFELEPY